MKVIILDNAQQIGEAAGKLFVDAIRENPHIVLGLATGATPIPTYQYMYKAYENGEVSFKDVRTYNLDEYVNLPKADKNSYYTFMHEQLFNHTDILEENVHFLNGNASDVESECQRYDEELREAGIDIQLLGIGRNGHIGFNEPSDAFTKSSFQVQLTDSTIAANSKYFDENPMPHYALTMGVGSIMTAKKIVLIATGKEKAEAMAAMIHGDVSPNCPASILNFHPDSVVFMDKEAASLL